MPLNVDRFAYLLKRRLPQVFTLVEQAARVVTGLRYGARIDRARSVSRIEGSVSGKAAVIRALGFDDVATLQEFLGRMPDEHLEYFHPHGFDHRSLEAVLKSKAFLPYGLFVDDEMVAYALLKISPSGAAFLGRLVKPEYAGKGVGKFLARFLYWQAFQARLRPHSTISKQNSASLQSHRANRDFRVVSELPNEFLLLEFPRMPADENPPTLACG